MGQWLYEMANCLTWHCENINDQLGYGVALPPEKATWCQVEMRLGGTRAKLDVVKNRSLCPLGGNMGIQLSSQQQSYGFE
jgi:hypothetical protein